MYGFQLLLELGVTTIELILSFHLMLTRKFGIQNVESNTVGHFVSLMSAWLLHHTFKLISITAPCHFTTNEMDNTAMLVQHFDQNTVAELQLFSLQLLQRKVKFTAFGFLILDHSVLFGIIGCVTTCLFVVMQYVG
jgi:hypothetical protein